MFVHASRPQLDKYMPCVSLIDDVFRIKAKGLLVAGFASVVMLAWFGTSMYLVERNDDDVQVKHFASCGVPVKKQSRRCFRLFCTKHRV